MVEHELSEGTSNNQTVSGESAELHLMAFLSKVAIRTSLLGPRGLNWEMRRCGQRLKASGCDGRGYCQGGSHQSKVSGWMNGWFGACNVGAIQGF